MPIRLFCTALMIAAVIATFGMTNVLAKAVTHDGHPHLSEMMASEDAAPVEVSCNSPHHSDIHCQLDQTCLASSCSGAVRSGPEIMSGSGEIAPLGTLSALPKKPPRHEFVFV
jgi:hypothetical protein